MERRKFFSDNGFENFEIESYEEFSRRIFSFQKSDFSFGVDRFVSSGSVKNKVGFDGKFNRFIGDTVVFDLDDSQKKFIYEYYVNPLYWVAPDCLAEQLKESTFHMTLHDLNASTQDDFMVMKRMFETEISLARVIDESEIKSEKIDMATTCVFNMVNTSLVLGLKPKTYKDYYKLMSLYQLVEGIYQLPYPFTPHITLAYYCRDGFEGKQLEILQNTVNELNCESFDITLSTDRLYYQKFISMNDYFNVMRFVK